MASDDIEIDVIVNLADANRKLDDLGSKLDDASRSAEGASGGFSKFQANILSVEASVQLATRAFQAANTVFLSTFKALDSALVVEGLSRGFDSLQKSVGSTASESLPALREATLGLVDDLGLMQSANQAVLLGVDDGSGKFASLAGDAIKLGQAMGIQAKDAVDSLTIGLGRQSKQVLDNLGIIVDANSAYQDFADRNNLLVGALTDTQKQLAFNEAGFEAVRTKAAELGRVHDTSAIQNQRLQVTIANLTKEFLKEFSASEDLSAALVKLNKALNNIDVVSLAEGFATLAAKIIDTTAAIVDFTNRAIQGLNNLQLEQFAIAFGSVSDEARVAFETIILGIQQLEPTQNNVNALTSELEKLAQVVIFGPQGGAGVGLRAGFEEAKEAIERWAISTAQAGETVKKTTAEIEKQTQAISKSTEATKDLADELEGLEAPNLINASFVDPEDGDLGDPKNQPKFEETFIGKLSIGLANSGITTAINQIDADRTSREKGKEIGTSLGASAAAAVVTAYGAAFLAPAAASVGGFLGGIKGEIFLEAILGGTDAEANAREAVNKFLDKVFDVSKLQIIRDGFLQELFDFESGGREAFDESEGFGVFNTLSEQGKAAFEGIGQAINALLETGQDVGGQIGGLLASNLGGDLFNLSLAIKATGLSFEELREGIISTALTGQQSFLAVEGQLAQLGKLAEGGVPGQLGAVEVAFEKVKQAGVLGGQTTISALQAVGIEAEELGKKTLVELEQSLLDSGVAADEAAQLISSLGKIGIDSVTELANATDRELISVLANLEANGFNFFEGAKDQVTELVNTLENIPDNIETNVTVNVRTNALDSGAQGLIDSDFQGLGLDS